MRLYDTGLLQEHQRKREQLGILVRTLLHSAISSNGVEVLTERDGNAAHLVDL